LLAAGWFILEINIPSISITGAIGRDLLNHDINVPDDELERQIRNVVQDKFVKKYEQNRRLFEHADQESIIRIEVRDDMGEKRSHALASFNLFRSNMTGEIHFSVSSHLVYAELLARKGLSSSDYNLSDEGYWSHEFDHIRVESHLLTKDMSDAFLN